MIPYITLPSPSEAATPAKIPDKQIYPLYKEQLKKRLNVILLLVFYFISIAAEYSFSVSLESQLKNSAINTTVEIHSQNGNPLFIANGNKYNNYGWERIFNATLFEESTLPTTLSFITIEGLCAGYCFLQTILAINLIRNLNAIIGDLSEEEAIEYNNDWYMIAGFKVNFLFQIFIVYRIISDSLLAIVVENLYFKFLCLFLRMSILGLYFFFALQPICNAGAALLQYKIKERKLRKQNAS